jgi:hypothetical protein
MKRLIATAVAVLTFASGVSVASATTITVRTKIGIAQRIVQGMEYFDPADGITLTTADADPIGGLESVAYFFCNACAIDFGDVAVYDSHADAIGWAEADVQGFPTLHSSSYVAGDALFTLVHASERIVKAFGRAVGKPVVTVKASVQG